eukprot:GEMP01025167.1.p1 GENE.GEMP01025167.1~~GEMP01025167.1.p1  ORF type:complete len:547 (+),score=122.53 GEMP01025167.1:43-1683(+)
MDARQGRPVVCFPDESALVSVLLHSNHVLWRAFAKVKAKTVYVPASLKLCEEVKGLFKKADMESTEEDDLQNVCCVRVIDTQMHVTTLGDDVIEKWAEKQYLLFLGSKCVPDLYGVRFVESWKENTKEDGYAMPGLSGCIVYAEGTVEALGGPILRITDGKKVEIPMYDSIAKLGLGLGAGPIRKVARWIYDAKDERKCSAFTGAGISAESGVPTYRDVGGLWTTFNAMEVSSIKGLVRDPRKVWKFEEMFFSLLRQVTFNPGHKAMADLEAKDYMKGIITQNVDGLHQAAGSKEVLELHGSEVNAICLACKERTPMVDVFDVILPKGESTTNDPNVLHPDPERSAILKAQLLAYQESCAKSDSSSSDSDSDGSTSSSSSSSSSKSGSRTLSSCGELKEGPRVLGCPTCPKCQGFLKPDGIYFGEPLVKGVLQNCMRMAIDSEVILIVGTSGKVSPARQLPLLARKEPEPSKVVEVNPNNTLLSNHADIRLIGQSAKILPQILAEVELLEESNSASLRDDMADTDDGKLDNSDSDSNKSSSDCGAE